MNLSLLQRRILRVPATVWILWFMAALAVPIWVQHDSSAWDLRVYGKAIDSLQAGHDPYADATSIQKQHHAERVTQGSTGIEVAPPYSYVYAPLTLPLLKAVGHVPRTLSIGLYWSLYVIGALGAVAVGATFATSAEYPAVLYMAGVAVFFPGMLANGSILSGNVAYLSYAAVFAMALVGWRRGSWVGFYVVVLLVASIKAPLLSLALIAPLSAPREWLKASAAIACGFALYAAQPFIWPLLFRHYVEAVELQFSFNQDFGCSPAGLFSSLLAYRGLSYSPASYFFYAGYAVLVFAALITLSRRFLRGDFSLSQWGPVLLTGVILLNPRIQEYDSAAITLPMALIAWRMTTPNQPSGASRVTAAVTLLFMNAGALYSWEVRKALDGPLMVLLFVAGCLQLLRTSRAVTEATMFTKDAIVSAQT